MIAVFTALYPEAQQLLDRFRKHGARMKRLEAGNLSVWKSEDENFLLALTGSGEIASAVTTARVLTQFPADFAVNFGTAAGNEPVGSCFCIDKITEEATERDFYPGLEWRMPFGERALVTVPRVAPQSSDSGISHLIDMEGAGFFQAAARFLSPDRIVLLKVVSDAGNSSGLTADDLRKACEVAAENVAGYLFWLQQAADARAGAHADAWETQLLAKAEKDLHGSEAMRQQLRRIFRWQALAGEDPEKLVHMLYADGSLPASDKKKGKEVLEQLERDIL